MNDIISREAVADAISLIECTRHTTWYEFYQKVMTAVEKLPSAQPETATVTIGRTKGGVTMWYECDACGEPVDQKDSYCRNCGRKLKHE